jgi:uncharacterized cupredoxin-like copper-binding protein
MMFCSRNTTLCAAALALFFSAGAAFATETIVQVDDMDLSAGKMAMKLSVTEVKAGKITFVSANKSDKKRDHEVLLVKTDLAPQALPRTIDGQSIDEKKLPGLLELGDLKPGKTKKKVISLTPGKYLLLCNIPGHTDAGMFAQLTVTE